MLCNKKLKLRRRLAVQDFRTQVMISLPSILLPSCLISSNNPSLWFWSLFTILFERQQTCSYFGRSYHASSTHPHKALILIICHLSVILAYLSTATLLTLFFPITGGILNGISCGILIYDVMIEKLANSYEEKTHLVQKVGFVLLGVGVTCFIGVE